jgi:hypothetical protein
VKTLPPPAGVAHADVRAHGLGQLPDDGQPQADAGPRLLDMGALLERQEYPFPVCGGDAAAAVFHLDVQVG